MDLFTEQSKSQNRTSPSVPLAQRRRPQSFDEILGQDHLLGQEGLITRMLAQEHVHSFILWGSPGSGKTSIAKVFAQTCGIDFFEVSAALGSMKEIKEIMLAAKKRHRTFGKPTVIFVDEIHRCNKAQQDAFLPFVEAGDIVLIGATTENPSFEIRNALLSRMRVYTLKELTPEHIETLLGKAMAEDLILKKKKQSLDPKACKLIAKLSQGDVRSALTLLESVCAMLGPGAHIEASWVHKVMQKKNLYYDKNGEFHFDLISALHKSLRNSDENASLYWLGRMLEGGEDPMYIVRRLIRFASEDIGLADSHALVLATSAKEAVHMLGMPEAGVCLAQLVIYLAQSPKSNSAYRAYQSVQQDLNQGHVYPVPLAIRNAPTKLMKQEGYGKGYSYAHDHSKHTTSLVCLPEVLEKRKYYQASSQGQEIQIGERVQTWAKLRKELRKQEQENKTS